MIAPVSKAKLIYKYCKIDKNLVNNLLNNQLYYSPPVQFSDPFDCNLKIKSMPKSEDDVINFINRFFDIDISGQKEVLIRLFRDKNKLAATLNTYIKRIFNETIGITCFSKKDNDLLMWSHYADSHKGLVLTFEPKKDISGLAPIEVKYLPDIPEIDFFANKNEEHKIIFTKSDKWAYEEELRSKKNSSGLYKFEPTALIGLKFGCRTDQNDIEMIMQIAKSKYSHIKFKKAIQLENTFGLKFQTITV